MSTEAEEIKARIAELQAQLDAIDDSDAEAERWAKVYADCLGVNYPDDYWGWGDYDAETQHQLTSAMRPSSTDFAPNGRPKQRPLAKP